MAGKYGVPYFANFINSELDVRDVRSMAILGTQELIYRDKFGRVSKGEIRSLYNTWEKYPNNRPKYEMLMNGKFVPVTEMFKIPYDKYETIVEIKLENGIKQPFSYDHKCLIVRDGEKMEILSQDVKAGDKFLLAKNAYNVSDKYDIGAYESGLIVGYYLAEGWESHHGSEIVFAINENREDIVDRILRFFESNLGFRMRVEHDSEGHVYEVHVFSHSASMYMNQFISGDSAINKRLSTNIFDTSSDFRKGVYDGYLDTDGFNKRKILAHTTNKELCKDLMILGATIGRYSKLRVNENNTRYFKPDKSDLVKFTSYELKIMNLNEYGEYYEIAVSEVNQRSKGNTTHVYNFTVDTDEHLYTLPNGIITHQCCRLRLDLSQLAHRNGGLFGAGDSTGSIGVVTLNLPRMAYEAKGDKDKFYEALEKYMIIAKDSLEIKRRWLQENVLDTGLIPAYKEYVGTLRNHFSTIGIIGMNEMCENLLGKNILDDESHKFCLEVGSFIRNKLLDFQNETGNLYNYEATPAESTCYRFAKIDREKYPDIITQGEPGVEHCYYTNSCHIPVKYIKSIDETFKHQNDLQSQFTGGTVIHCYLEGAISGEQAKEIVYNMINKYSVPYMSLSPISRYCPEHGYIVDHLDKCPYCDERLVMYQRVTGYLRCVDGFNNGKAAEFKDRVQL